MDAIDQRTRRWQCGQRTLELGDRSVVMGVLNVTPDSFSDGGRYTDRAVAVQHALRMIDEGADIIDVGGESTRPGADPVSPGEEVERVVPIIGELRAASDILISVDTSKATVARAACLAGADIINDISALTRDPEMVSLVCETGAGVVLMHMQGEPRTMQQAPAYVDVVAEVKEYLSERLVALAGEGVSRNQVVLDPGIGFGKTLEHNLDLLAGLPALASLGCPLLVGISRKSMIGMITGRELDDRLAGSLAAGLCAVFRGAQILRVHDVKETCDALAVADMLKQRSTEWSS